jgi:hypothetical protein
MRPDMTMQKAEALVAKAVSEVEADEAFARYDGFDVREWRIARRERARHERAMATTIPDIEFRLS